MTEASQLALEGLRDLSTIKWYAIPLLAIVFYVYTVEIRKARESGNWDAVFAALTLLGMDFFNETWNGWVFHFSGHSAVWTVPGETAFRAMVGWNLEIIFMFALAGFAYYYSLEDKAKKKILGVPNRWFWAVAYAAFCVFIEVLLNQGGHLVWEYPWWNSSFAGVWLIFLIGYFHFYVAIIIVLGLKKKRYRARAIAGIWSVAIVMNIVAGILGWTY
jgi:hypothetical protein